MLFSKINLINKCGLKTSAPDPVCICYIRVCVCVGRHLNENISLQLKSSLDSVHYFCLDAKILPHTPKPRGITFYNFNN